MKYLRTILKTFKPLFIEESMVPKLLSYLSPINIGAITLGLVVFSRDKMSDRTKRHETIHFQQYLDLFFIGFIFVYLFDYFYACIKYRDFKFAYYRIRFEQEAYMNDGNEDYLLERTRYNWISLDI